MSGPRDILDEFEQQRRGPRYRQVAAQVGMLVEDRASGFCGDVVKVTIEAVTLRDRHGAHRHFRYREGAFLIDGRPVTLVRPASTAAADAATPKLTASGSVASALPARAKVAVGHRIWVEGRHDAELVEHVWGDDLRDLAIVVEPMHGIDELAAAVAEFAPTAERRLGILVDHLVTGSKEHRLASAVRGDHVLVTGHPFVDVWAAVRPSLVGLEEWPDVPKGQSWKDGVCAALGADPSRFWPQLRNRVRTYADLRPELVGSVERLLDFVTAG
jgi:hypothetical protein